MIGLDQAAERRLAAARAVGVGELGRLAERTAHVAGARQWAHAQHLARGLQGDRGRLSHGRQNRPDMVKTGLSLAKGWSGRYIQGR